jgi:hypothetical protein
MFVSPNDRVSGSCRQSGDVLTGDGGLGATTTAFPDGLTTTSEENRAHQK